jgi:hypothetical protein
MRRSTVIVVILFLLLGGLYWYTRQEGNSLDTILAGNPTPSSTPPGYLVEPYIKSVTSLTVRKPGSPPVTLTLNGGIWQMQLGDETVSALDQDAANSVAFNIQDLRILSSVEAAGKTLSDFGLDAETATGIEAEFSDGSSIKILVGKATVIGNGYYAITQEQPDQILVINKLSLDSLLSLPENPPVLITDTLESTPTPEQ